MIEDRYISIIIFSFSNNDLSLNLLKDKLEELFVTLT